MAKETEQQTIARIQSEAQAGDVQSQFNLGRILFTGYGVARDDTGARRSFGAAAKQGHSQAQAQAQTQYGAMLYNGQGGPADRAEGLNFVRKACDQGEAYAKALQGFFSLLELNKTRVPTGARRSRC